MTIRNKETHGLFLPDPRAIETKQRAHKNIQLNKSETHASVCGVSHKLYRKGKRQLILIVPFIIFLLDKAPVDSTCTLI